MQETKLQPMPGYALIELEKKHLSVDKDKFGTHSKGKLIYVGWLAGDPYDSQIDAEGKTVYFTPYEDGDTITDNGKEYVFVKIEHIRGVMNV